ncbi:UNVERIFIED_CONTAM: hypothetical protein HDU68_010066 [Siphonaria sp. JEL0065]|nr:hypothetical protein HDU68_010066 [Siphonaria sp. JEL0065]
MNPPNDNVPAQVLVPETPQAATAPKLRNPLVGGGSGGAGLARSGSSSSLNSAATSGPATPQQLHFLQQQQQQQQLQQQQLQQAFSMFNNGNINNGSNPNSNQHILLQQPPMHPLLQTPQQQHPLLMQQSQLQQLQQLQQQKQQQQGNNTLNPLLQQQLQNQNQNQQLPQMRSLQSVLANKGFTGGFVDPDAHVWAANSQQTQQLNNNNNQQQQGQQGQNNAALAAQRDHALTALMSTFPALGYAATANILAQCEWDVQKAGRTIIAMMDSKIEPTSLDAQKRGKLVKKADLPAYQTGTASNSQQQQQQFNLALPMTMNPQQQLLYQQHMIQQQQLQQQQLRLLQLQQQKHQQLQQRQFVVPQYGNASQQQLQQQLQLQQAMFRGQVPQNLLLAQQQAVQRNQFYPTQPRQPQQPVIPRKPLLMQSQAPKQRKRKNNNEDSEDDEEEHYGSEEDDDDSEHGGYQEDGAHTAMMEIQMYEFFSKVDKKELLDTLMCTEDQADTIIEFRPFESVQDLYEKFEIHKRGKKRIAKLLEKYQTLMAGYSQVDQLINQCEKRGGEVLSVMEKWIEKGAETSPSKKGFPSVPAPDDSTAASGDFKVEDAKKVDGGAAVEAGRLELKEENVMDALSASVSAVASAPIAVDMKPKFDRKAAVTRRDRDDDADSEASGPSEASENSEEDAGLHITSVPNIKEGQGSLSAGVRPDPELCLTCQPGNLNHKMKLKSYQLVGVSWLNLLYSKGLGGILADEMGLGKTAQVIAFISLLKHQGDTGTPHLIIVPSSTLENWLREFANWSPELNILSYYGSQADRENIRYNVQQGDVAQYDVVVTTYNLAASSKEDRVFLKKMKPRSMILDEGHMVKNMQSSRYQSLNSIRTPFRLLLTGTPLQNNLMELLSLLTFIMPKIFANDEEALKQIFSLKPTTTSDTTVLNRQRIHRAKQMMTPFVLRRKKDNVLKELPTKLRKEVFCDMTESQKKIYSGIISDCKKSLFKTEAPAADVKEPEVPTPVPMADDDAVSVVSGDEPPSKRRKGGATVSAAAKKKAAAAAAAAVAALAPPKKVTGDNTNVLMQLRKAANHPLLFRRIYDNDKLKVMAREIMREEQYMEANIDYIREDMEYMSDFQLHKLCLNFRSIQHHALTNEEWMDSGKVEWLKTTLPEMIEKGDRVLIFSQFVIMLDVLESVMTTLGIKFVRLDGSTNVVDRQALIDDFNDDPTIGVFLLSTKAGGLGLNLTSSNVVIIHDMDFNPHNDAQAEDRAHRVGQTRDVTVIKLVVSGSVEQHILKLATTKLKLDKSLQQKQADEDQDGDDNNDEGTTTKKGKGKKAKEEAAAATLLEEESAPSAADDKKLMEMLRSEWRESGVESDV